MVTDTAPEHGPLCGEIEDKTAPGAAAVVVPLAAAVVVPGSAAVVVWPTELPTKQSAMKTARYFIVEVSRFMHRFLFPVVFGDER